MRLDLAAIPVPPVFGWLAKTGGVAEAEMLRTFNCGIGMIAIVGAADEEQVVEAWSPPDESPVRIGEVIAASDGEPVRTMGGLRL